MKYLCFLFVFCCSISFAQFDKEPFQQDARPINSVIFEAIPYWNVDTAAIDLIILYRVSSSFLIFTKAGSANQEYYEAKGELIVEIMDSSNNTIERDYRPMRILRNSMPADDALPPDEIQGVFTFALKKGFYKIIAEAKDDGSGKSFINRDIRVNAQSVSDSGINISPVMFIDPIKTDSSLFEHTTFFPINHGGNVIIRQEGACMFQVVTPDTSAGIQLDWKIQKKDEYQDEISLESQGDRYFQQIGSITGIESTKRIIFKIKKGSLNSRFIFAPIPVERLNVGTYTLTIQITQGILKSNKETRFKVIWPHMPFSLSNPKLAVEALSLIASEEEIDEMSSFGSGKSRKAFQAFWHKRNPDTTRAYNSVMAEYYRRVDESIKRFSTANEMDGYRTDRGRIYTLYGAPSIVNRLLKPDSFPTEIWTYEKLRKRFTFNDMKRNGNYILVKTEND